MREKTNLEKIKALIKEISQRVKEPTKIYFTGGASVVFLGFRESTIDVDIKPVPDSDEVLQSLSELKEKLNINIELASPADFIPEVPGWEGRSKFITQGGAVSFFHYDFYSQALSKIERGHTQDLKDLEDFIMRGYVEIEKLLYYFNLIKDKLYRFPAIDPESFERDVKRIVKKFKNKE